MAEITAPFVRLDKSEQAKDIKASKGPRDIWRGYARVKQYVKTIGSCPEGGDRNWLTTHPRELEFDQPHQVASARTGLSPMATNRVYSGVMHGCNADCLYCFCDKGMVETVEVTPEQYVDDYVAFNATQQGFMSKTSFAGVLRYSGGEVMLRPKWLRASLQYAINETRPKPVGAFLQRDADVFYLWIDTNLTIEPSSELATLMSRYGGTPLGVCGCFKPECDFRAGPPIDIDEQLRIAETYIKAGVDIYFYYPSWGGEDEELIELLEKLADISEYAPLRVCVIEIKWKYAAMRERQQTVGPAEARAMFQTRRELWGSWCMDRYPPEMLWLPSHQVEL